MPERKGEEKWVQCTQAAQPSNQQACTEVAPSNLPRFWQFMSRLSHTTALCAPSRPLLPSRPSPSLHVSKLAMLKVYPSRQQNQNSSLCHEQSNATETETEINKNKNKKKTRPSRIMKTLLVIIGLLAAAHALRPAALARPHHVVRWINLGLKTMHSLDGGSRLCAVVVESFL